MAFVRSWAKAALLAATVSLVSACGSAIEGPVKSDQGPDDGWTAYPLAEPYVASDVELTDTDGNPTSLKSVATKPLTLVFFGYTKCDDVCPLKMGNITSALQQLPEELRDEVDVVFVTTDPERDDPKTLGDWLKGYNKAGDYIGLTGDLDDIIDAAYPFGVYVEQGEKLDSGGYDVTHGDTVTGVLPDGTAPLVWTDFNSKQMAADLTRALTEGMPTPAK